MANLTAGRDDKRQEGDLIDVPFGTNTIYAGALVCVDASGYAVKGDNSKQFLGVAMENTANATAEGRDYIRVWCKGEFEFNMTSAAATDLGKVVIVGADDNTVAAATEVSSLASTTLTAATAYGKIVGKIVAVTDTTNGKVRVRLGL